jgi:hypothetical protein
LVYVIKEIQESKKEFKKEFKKENKIIKEELAICNNENTIIYEFISSLYIILYLYKCHFQDHYMLITWEPIK